MPKRRRRRYTRLRVAGVRSSLPTFSSRPRNAETDSPFTRYRTHLWCWILILLALILNPFLFLLNCRAGSKRTGLAFHHSCSPAVHYCFLSLMSLFHGNVFETGNFLDPSDVRGVESGGLGLRRSKVDPLRYRPANKFPSFMYLTILPYQHASRWLGLPHVTNKQGTHCTTEEAMTHGLHQPSLKMTSLTSVAWARSIACCPAIACK